MKSVLKLGAVMGVASLVSACAATYDVDHVSMMSAQGDAFSQALHKRYVERAQFEVSEGDWSSVDFFATRAKAAAGGTAPALQMPADRALKADADDINQAHMTLSAALKTAAPKVAPDACARAQTWLEHWMEQAEEGHQPDHIKAARDGFMSAMPDCKGEMAAPAPTPMAAVPGPLVIYFTHDSFDVSSANMDLIQKAANAAKAANVKRVVLIGHADRSGSAEYNQGLSRARVVAVGNAIMEAGIARNMVVKNFAGETSPQVKTDDGVRERMNRRVEVMFER